MVTNSEGTPSAPSTTTISTLNSRPNADAGRDQSVTSTGTIVALDGSASWDDNGDALTFFWQLVVPTGSQAVLSDPTAVGPTFQVDLYGDYEAFLELSDSLSTSEPDVVVISFTNLAPLPMQVVNRLQFNEILSAWMPRRVATPTETH